MSPPLSSPISEQAHIHPPTYPSIFLSPWLTLANDAFLTLYTPHKNDKNNHNFTQQQHETTTPAHTETILKKQIHKEWYYVFCYLNIMFYFKSITFVCDFLFYNGFLREEGGSKTPELFLYDTAGLFPNAAKSNQTGGALPSLQVRAYIVVLVFFLISYSIIILPKKN